MITANQRTISVGLGELSITSDASVVLTCNGLGSCIALCIYDPVARLGGMAHMLLPVCRTKNENDPLPSKYIDTGAPLLITRMIRKGSQKQNLIVKIAGGARMLAVPGNSHLDIGQKNIAEIKAVLQRENLVISGADIGGGFGRTVRFQIDNGKITVKSVNGVSLDL